MLIVIADDTALVTIPERETRSFAPCCSVSTSVECATALSKSPEVFRQPAPARAMALDRRNLTGVKTGRRPPRLLPSMWLAF
jgi:hypothetical protein